MLGRSFGCTQIRPSQKYTSEQQHFFKDKSCMYTSEVYNVRIKENCLKGVTVQDIDMSLPLLLRNLNLVELKDRSLTYIRLCFHLDLTIRTD